MSAPTITIDGNSSSVDESAPTPKSATTERSFTGNPNLSNTAAKCVAFAMRLCAPWQREALLELVISHAQDGLSQIRTGSANRRAA